MKKINKNIIYIIGFIVIFLIIFVALGSKLLFTPDFGESDAYHSDISGKFYLWQNLVQNKLSFWTNNSLGGYPLFSSWGLLGGLYFMHILAMKFFSFVSSYNLIIVSTFFITALGFFFLLKEFKVSSLLAFLISLSFAFNGAISMRLVHLSVIETFSLVPFLFLVTIRYFNTKRRIYLLLFPIILSQMFFAGFIQVIFIALLGLSLFLAVYLKIKFNNFKEVVRGLLLFIFLVLVGCLFALPQILPSMQLNNFTVRDLKLDYPVIVSLPFQTQNIINFIFPFAFGNPKYGTYPPFNQDWGIFWENTPYLGIIFAIISLISLVVFVYKSRDKKHKKLVYFNLLIILFLLLLVLGKNSPLYLIFNLFPFNLFRTQARFLLIMNFFIFFTFSLTLNFLYKKSKPIIKLFLILLLLVNFIDLLLFAKDYHLFVEAKKVLEPPIITKNINNNYRYLTVGQEEVWNNVFIKKGWANKEDENDYLFFKNFLYSNSNLIFGNNLFDIYTGYGLKLKRPEYIRSLIINNLQFDKGALTIPKSIDNLLEMVNIRYFIFSKDVKSQNIKKIKEYKYHKNSIFLYQLSNIDKLDNNFYYSPEKLKEIRYLSDFEALLDNNNNFISEAVVENNIGLKVKEKLRFDIKRKVFKDDLIYLEGQFENDGFLVIKNNFYPEWELYINNKKYPIYKTNLIHMGFFVPKGYNRIEFRYSNNSFKIGMFISIIVFLLYCLYLYFPLKFFK